MTKLKTTAMLAAALSVTAGSMWAHHSLAATFDLGKTTTLNGTVTKVDWTNPHVYVYVDANNGQPWEVEFDSRVDLRSVGWTPDSVKVGDSVAIEGNPARDNARLLSGKTITIGSRKLTAAPKERKLAPVRAAGYKAAETPRWPDGHPRLGPAPGEKGYWADPVPAALVQDGVGNIPMDSYGLLANIADAGKVAPFQPWAKALYEYRQKNKFADDPMAACIPPSGPRQFEDRYGVQLIEQPERKRAMILSVGGNRNWRMIDMDGRPLADPDDVTPTFFGYSVGHWEGDTLVIESRAYQERFWFSNGGLPHSEHLNMVERISRPDHDTLKYQVTITDPDVYTKPWTSTTTLSWVPNADAPEYFCDDNNRETEHLSGKHEQK